jgi:hypothetical protein
MELQVFCGIQRFSFKSNCKTFNFLVMLKMNFEIIIMHLENNIVN